MADRISTFPDSVLCHILSFLTTKQSAKTTTLSKRWKPLWLSVPTLNFDDETFTKLITFRNSIYTIMFSRDITIPIHSFRFKLSENNSNSFDPYDLNRFIYFAMQRGLENLDININIKLPVNILSCKMVKVLKLKNINLIDLSYHQVNFPCLKILHLNKVYFQCHEYLVKFLFGCPILEELQTKHLGVGFGLGDSLVSEEEFPVLPCLIKAKIFDEYFIPLTLVRNVENLVLELRTWTCCSKFPMFHNLTHMELKFNSIYWPNRWNWLLQMLEHCPKLQSFTFQDCVEQDQYDDKSWKDPLIVPKCLTSQLRTFCLEGYKGRELELQFAKYIIQNSEVLQTMTFKCTTSSVDIIANHQMLENLFSCTPFTLKRHYVVSFSEMFVDFVLMKDSSSENCDGE